MDLHLRLLPRELRASWRVIFLASNQTRVVYKDNHDYPNTPYRVKPNVILKQMAGPVLIFDKSTLHGLSVDEAVWLDNSYLTNITPLFFIETLADLEKDMAASGRTPEQLVGNLAEKTPDMGASINVHHMALIQGELLTDGRVDMRTGRPHLAGGSPMELEGKMGVMFTKSPEEEAFHRWQDGDFLEVERKAAKAWRRALEGLNLEDIYLVYRERLSDWKQPTSLQELKKQVDLMFSHPDQENLFRMALAVVGVSEEMQPAILMRWNEKGRRAIKEYAPYFAHVASVDLFFSLGIASNLIGRGRPSNRVDIAYLYYLPFCMVFSSEDKLHRSIVPLFLRERQTFVSGTDLKADLKALDEHYSALPPEIKGRGLMHFAFYPPDDTSFLLTRLWDKHMNPKWREHMKESEEDRKSYPRAASPVTKPLFDAIRRAEAGGEPMKPFVPVDSEDANHIVIKRSVKMRKGKWERFPPEVRNRKQDEAGE